MLPGKITHPAKWFHFEVMDTNPRVENQHCMLPYEFCFVTVQDNTLSLQNFIYPFLYLLHSWGPPLMIHLEIRSHRTMISSSSHHQSPATYPLHDSSLPTFFLIYRRSALFSQRLIHVSLLEGSSPPIIPLCWSLILSVACSRPHSWS